MKPWSEARTFAELCEINVRFLRGELSESPSHGGPPDPETEEIQEALIRINRQGLFTIDSQPGYDGPGYDGGVCRQRAIVDGFAPQEVALAIAARQLHSDLIVLWFPPGDEGSMVIPVTQYRGRPSAWGGSPAWEDLERYALACPTVIPELKDLWFVMAVDPVWGRKDYLWETLVAPAREGYFAEAQSES